MPQTAGAALRLAASSRDIALARALFVEYARWLNVDLCFQGFDRELAALPGAYAPPFGRLLLAGAPEAAFGCIALRPAEASQARSPACGGITGQVETWSASAQGPANATAAPCTGEVKRLFVQPAHRGGGWGLRLAEALIADARAIGYQELKLDTLDWMAEARRLYAALGFR